MKKNDGYRVGQVWQYVKDKENYIVTRVNCKQVTLISLSNDGNRWVNPTRLYTKEFSRKEITEKNWEKITGGQPSSFVYIGMFEDVYKLKKRKNEKN
jgi:hypothetical protein